jgi:hypothetical protein
MISRRVSIFGKVRAKKRAEKKNLRTLLRGYF